MFFVFNYDLVREYVQDELNVLSTLQGRAPVFINPDASMERLDVTVFRLVGENILRISDYPFSLVSGKALYPALQITERQRVK